MIKAIETEYNGYRFRSRLEARWAVFFDTLGVEYQYEVEGFDLHYCGWYLPDFYLPSYQTYIEIKPFPEKHEHGRPEIFDHEATQKVLELSWATGKWVILAFGEPLVHRACWFDGKDKVLEFPDAAIGFSKELYPTFWEGQVIDIEEGEKSKPFEYDHREAGIVARQARFGQNGRG